MAGRPSWKGALRVGDLTCDVEAHTAQSAAERISFTTLNARTGNRVRQAMVVEETGAEVAREDQAKGIEVGRSTYLVLEPDEIAAARPEANHILEVERFVAQGDVEPFRLDGSHYLAPAVGAGEALGVLIAAMEAEGVAGIGRVTLSTRERLVLLRPRGRGLLMTTMHWDYQVRPAASVFGEITTPDLDEDMKDLASHVLGRKRGTFDFSDCRDEYEEALKALIAAKAEGRDLPTPAARPTAEVVDLRDALKRSLEAESTGRKPAPAARRRKAG